jgi:hypothetical protein
MKEVLVASCVISAAALGAVALSAQSITDRTPSEMAGVRIAQAAPPTGQPGTPADEPAKATPADRPNGQTAPADQKAQAADDRDDDDDDRSGADDDDRDEGDD